MSSRLLDAAYDGNTDECSRLLSLGVDVNAVSRGYCCLWSSLCLYVSAVLQASTSTSSPPLDWSLRFILGC